VAPTAARAAALRILRDVRGGTFADRALDAAAAGLGPRDRAFLQELVYCTLRLRGRIDHILAALSSRPLARIDPDILDVLRLGVCQLHVMDGVPTYAAVSQSVELARDTGSRGGAGFVNGVLQSLRRSGGAIEFPSFDADPAGHLTTWGSHPRWLVDRWLAHYGAVETQRLVEANNRRPRPCLRLTGDVAAAAAQLEAAGIATESVPLSSRALVIDGADLAAALDAAPVIVQDPAAGLVADFVAPPAGAIILDLAAAPGGKSIALAAGEPAPAYVIAADASFPRLSRVRQNVRRLARPAPRGIGPLPLGMVVADARMPPFRPADVVLLDAPCTGTGTLRRHPDGRWRLKPGDVAALADLQAAMLDAAAGAVAPGGLLVYATCSLEPEENELQVLSFLRRNPGFVIEPGPVPDAVPLVGGMLCVLPEHHGTDGAFAARLRRSA
jgi:16S rRNA (cytosine967-C5)-methyltransferase